VNQTVLLPFQGETVVGTLNPTRWVGLAYSALSGLWGRMTGTYPVGVGDSVKNPTALSGQYNFCVKNRNNFGTLYIGKQIDQKNLERIFAAFDETKISDYPNPLFVKTNSLFVMNIQNYLLRFLLDLVESSRLRVGSDISEDIQRAIDRMTGEDETFYTMKQLANVADLSESRFKHRFREEVGTTPADYQLRHKIDRACQMLIQDNMTILDTALSLGFSSSQYFATVFRRYMGVTPAEYRTINESPEYRQ
jgi:AraC-like DNA-binding protein